MGKCMKPFLDEHFLLDTKTAQRLFHDFAKELPIIDYHCHLPPQQIAEDTRFENLSQAWLYGDHYKWKAMRANGVEEDYCTGNKTDWEKFQQWAATVPYTLRNPLYHWTHLELQRYFNIGGILNADTAKEIYDSCTEKLATTAYSVRNLLRRMKVRVVCTTDDPTDSLQYHRQLKAEGFEIPVLPAFRPDTAMKVDDPAAFNIYLLKLEKAADKTIVSFSDYTDALKSRHDFFSANGCTVSDHGLENICAEDYTTTEIKNIFEKIRKGQTIDSAASRKFRSAMLVQFAEWDAASGWVQQYHIGALRDNNSRMKEKLGPDTGWDSIGDFPQAESLAKFLNRLDGHNKLAKTILYNSNPADNEVMATMIGNFNDGSVAGKIQWGAAWWFLDQKDGMIKQLNALSNMGLLSRFVGMLTDSRSFLSFPRHEYFRRLLCNLFGEEIEKGELPDDLDWTGKLIQDICFHNAKNYFSWQSICL
jgi:glucuronate isomerase